MYSVRLMSQCHEAMRKLDLMLLAFDKQLFAVTLCLCSFAIR